MKTKSLSLVICCCFLLVAACAPVTPSSSPDYTSSSAPSNENEQPKGNAEKQNASPNDFGLQGNYTILTTATNGERPKSYRNLLEFSDSVIVSSYMPNEQWNVEQFEIDSGKSIALIDSSNYADKGKLYEITYTQDKDGYDYCLLFEKGILYRSSSKYEDEIFESLPPNVDPKVRRINSSMAPYQRNETGYIWTGADGIMLSTLDKSNAVCILPNDQISAAFIDAKYPNAYINTTYLSPRFVNKGTEIIAQVRNEIDDLMGIVLYNLKDNAIVLSVELGPPFEATVYPSADRYICIGNGGSRIIDTLNRTVTKSPLNYLFKTYDCQRYIQVEVNNLDYDYFKAFLCTADKLEDRSNMILFSDGSNGIYIPNISKNYFTVTSENTDNFWLALVSY